MGGGGGTPVAKKQTTRTTYDRYDERLLESMSRGEVTSKDCPADESAAIAADDHTDRVPHASYACAEPGVGSIIVGSLPVGVHSVPSHLSLIGTEVGGGDGETKKRFDFRVANNPTT